VNPGLRGEKPATIRRSNGTVHWCISVVPKYLDVALFSRGLLATFTLWFMVQITFALFARGRVDKLYRDLISGFRMPWIKSYGEVQRYNGVSKPRKEPICKKFVWVHYNSTCHRRKDTKTAVSVAMFQTCFN
jgi:hypothetical protein